MAAKLNKGYFTKVAVARQLLKDKAEEILIEYLATVQLAKDNGNHDAALKALQWLIEHMPSEEDGTRLLDVSVDKNTQPIVQDTRPAIQIGIQLGGIPAGGSQKLIEPKKPKALKGEIIN